MILVCPQCQTSLDVSGVEPGRLAVCQQCHHHFQVPGKILARQAAPQYFPAPYPMPHNPLDFTENVEDIEEERRDRRDTLAERRELRDDRREDRKIRGLERESGMLGITALALAGTTLILVLSGLLFAKSLPFYGGIGGTLGVPMAIGSLITGFIGVLRPGRTRLYSGIACGVGAFLLLIMIPLLWVLLSQKNP